jgi:putative ABC transport system permease protein
VETLVQDLRYAARVLAKNPGFTLIAVLTLGLGIGANTALFSVVNAVLLQSMPYPHREQLIAFRGGQSWPDLSDIQQQAHTFDKIGAFAVWQFDLVGKGEPRLTDAALVSLDLFSALGVNAASGRTFSTADDLINGPRLVVVSDHFWKETLSGRTDAVGSAVTLSGNSYTVIGIMPAGFRLPTGTAEVYVPFRVGYPEAAPYRGVHMHSAVARLKAGVSLAQAQAELDIIAKVLGQAHPDENRDRRFVALSLQERFTGNVRPALLMLFGATALVLLIASANFANLLLSRTARRRQEMAVRAALGAARSRLLRQLVTESALLAVLGGIAGLIFAYWGQHALMVLKPKNLANVPPFTIDRAVLGFGLLTALATGCLCGLLPAIELNSTAGRNGSLRERITAASGSFAANVRQALIIAELALSLVLLCGAGLLLRSLLHVQGVNPGFNAEGLMTAHISLQQKQYDDVVSQDRFFSQLLDNLKATPGVDSASLVTELPLSGNYISHNFLIEGRPRPPEGAEPEAATNLITPEYFKTMQIPVLAGRVFTESDREGSAPAAIINESFAKQFFAGEDPLGKQVRYARAKGTYWMRIVGVVADTKDLGLDEDEGPAIYTPMMQKQEQWRRYASIVVRAKRGDPLALTPSVKQAVWQIDRQIPVTSVYAESYLLDQSIGPRRINTVLLSAFACVALLLAVIGLYGVISYATAQRTREIGVRMALGARRADVVLMVFREGVRLAIAGVAVGCIAALLSARLLSSLLFNVKPLDAISFAAGSMLLVLTALLATLIPARRAASVDPMVALRTE